MGKKKNGWEVLRFCIEASMVFLDVAFWFIAEQSLSQRVTTCRIWQDKRPLHSNAIMDVNTVKEQPATPPFLCWILSNKYVKRIPWKQKVFARITLAFGDNALMPINNCDVPTASSPSRSPSTVANNPKKRGGKKATVSFFFFE